MSGLSFSPKNLVLAVIAAIALILRLPLFVPTGAIESAPTIAKQTLSPAKLESELLPPHLRYCKITQPISYSQSTIAKQTLSPAKLESERLSPYHRKITQSIFYSQSLLSSVPEGWGYLLPVNINMPSLDSFERLTRAMDDMDFWREHKTASHPKEGGVTVYWTDNERHQYWECVLSVRHDLVQDRALRSPQERMTMEREWGIARAKEHGLDIQRIGLSAIYAPYLNHDLCSTFLTPFHFFVMVPGDLDGEFTALFNNGPPPRKVSHNNEDVSRNIYEFTHPSMDIPPNYSETLHVGPEATPCNNFPQCRDFVKKQYKGLRKIVDAEEEVNIFIHWLIYFAEKFPAVFEEPAQYESDDEDMTSESDDEDTESDDEEFDGHPAESDKGFFLPAFEAMLEGISKKTQLRLREFEIQQERNP